jgi:hypothetical protein
MRHGGADQVRVPGELGAAGDKRPQFHRRLIWLAGDEELLARCRLRDDLGKFRLCFCHRDFHGVTLTVPPKNANSAGRIPGTPPLPKSVCQMYRGTRQAMLEVMPRKR